MSLIPRTSKVEEKPTPEICALLCQAYSPRLNNYTKEINPIELVIFLCEQKSGSTVSVRSHHGSMLKPLIIYTLESGNNPTLLFFFFSCQDGMSVQSGTWQERELLINFLTGV